MREQHPAPQPFELLRQGYGPVATYANAGDLDSLQKLRDYFADMLHTGSYSGVSGADIDRLCAYTETVIRRKARQLRPD